MFNCCILKYTTLYANMAVLRTKVALNDEFLHFSQAPTITKQHRDCNSLSHFVTHLGYESG